MEHVLPLEGCPYCGDLEEVRLLDYDWERRIFLLDYCCEPAQAEWEDEFAHGGPGRQAWRHFFRHQADLEVRQVVEGMLDYGLQLGAIAQGEAKSFIDTHHRHHPAPAGWKFGLGCWNGPDLIGVAWVGRPVSRVLQQQGCLEVNRLCVRTDLEPRGLTWNACSLLYGASARRARQLGYCRIITYTRVDESGTSLRAAGWTRVEAVKGRSWHCRSRPREDRTEICDRWRWEKVLSGTAQPHAPAKASGADRVRLPPVEKAEVRRCDPDLFRLLDTINSGETK